MVSPNVEKVCPYAGASGQEIIHRQFQIMSLRPALFRNTLCALKPLLNRSRIMWSHLRLLI